MSTTGLWKVLEVDCKTGQFQWGSSANQWPNMFSMQVIMIYILCRGTYHA